jgi:ubiquinone/menaquinone biosynthesis C-methylase UbiE
MDGRAAYDWNQRVYDMAVVAKDYCTTSDLLMSEEAILAHIDDRIRGKSVLDIGVGGGRTTAHLAALAGRYVGIDYSAAMIRLCQARFPSIEFHVCSATDLSILEDDSIDVAWFSFNGIDYAYPADRVRILEEVRRVLRPRGTFVFSSHNLKTRLWRPALWPQLKWDWPPSRNLGGNLSSIRDHLISIYYFCRNKPHEIFGDGYAVRVDQAHEYRLLTYHVSPRYQVHQLETLLYDEIEVVAVNGSFLSRDDDPNDVLLYYVARKRAPTGDRPAS